MLLPETARHQFWSKVALPISPDGCMEWTAYKDRHGYGKANLGGRKGGVQFAHRISYTALMGEIPDGLVLDHLCRNTSCVRPTHLEVVPQMENVRRGQAGAHHARKTHCPQGHPYSGSNLYVRTLPSGTTNRICRACKSAKERAARARKKEIAA